VGKRPSHLVYAVDERPPLPTLGLLGLQQVAVVSVSLALPLVVARAAGSPDHVSASMLSMSMLAIGVASLLQAFRLGPFGAGYLIPGFCTANYLAPSIAAAQVGGLPLVYGMTMVAGAAELLLSRLLRVLRPYFPPEVPGIVVLLIGIELGLLAVDRIFEGHGGTEAGSHVLLGLAVFGVAVALSVYGWRSSSASTAIGVGYLLASVTGYLGAAQWQVIREAKLFSLPDVSHLSWSFDVGLVVPFLLGAVASTLKTIATVTTCQKINDADWRRPETGSIRRGVAADGFSTVIAGLIGAVGQNSATSGVGISSATGATSRYIAVAVAGWFVLMACLPGLAAVLMAMPDPVLGGALLFAASYVLTNGIQIIGSRALDSRRTAIVGFAVIVAVSRRVFPQFYDTLPVTFASLTASPLALGMSAALLMNLLLRLGIKRTASVVLDRASLEPGDAAKFIETQGATWAARRDVLERASFALTQLIDVVRDLPRLGNTVKITASFDEFQLDLRVSYRGPPLYLPSERPSAEDILSSPAGERLFAGYLLRQHADRVTAQVEGEEVSIRLGFEH
jgi:NCS2 family nucleobase:cation symporter-2